MTRGPLDVALECCRRRWSPIPIEYGAEEPENEGWRALYITERDAPLEETPNLVGLREIIDLVLATYGMPR